MREPVPGYYRVMRSLLEEIEQGKFIPGKPFITEREVCARFGVSRTTAARAINELVQEGVLSRHRGRGTFVKQPDGATLVPADVGTASIALVCNRLVGQHVLEIMRGIEHVCRAKGFHLLLYDSMESAEMEARSLRRARDAGVAGIIIYPVDGYANAAVLEELQREGVPFVMVDRYYPSLVSDVVVPDNVAAGYELTKYLIEQGHERIATIWGEVNCTSVQERLAGYKQAFRECGLPIRSELAALRPYESSSQEHQLTLLSSWLQGKEPPTAFLAANTWLLGLVANDLIRAGGDLPEHIALASMDDQTSQSLLTFAEAAVTLPSYDLGREAAQMLTERTMGDDQPPPRHLELPIVLSVAAPVAGRLRLLTAS